MGQRGISSPVYVEDGVYLWSPPAAAADVAIEQLAKARHKRIRATHIFIVPRRWTYLWRRKLYRSCDIRFNIKPGVSFWKKNEHEPLTIAIFFPFCRHKPWQLRRVPVLLELAGTQIFHLRAQIGHLARKCGVVLVTLLTPRILFQCVCR